HLRGRRSRARHGGGCRGRVCDVLARAVRTHLAGRASGARLRRALRRGAQRGARMTALSDTNALVGTHDIALIVLDTLRHDVAVAERRAGRTPNLAALFPGGWETRHSPATFTYAAHAAFFAGFLPTPARPGHHARRFALRFEGSETTGQGTCVLDGASIV